ncbi:MAG: hypothetical protein ACOX8Q_06305 [Christensenellales bacterium]
MSTEQNVLVARLNEVFSKLEESIDENGRELIKKTIENEVSKLEALQAERLKLDKLESRINESNIALTEADGRIDNLKTQMEGELRLVHEIFRGLKEHIERIDKNTSKEEHIKRTWRIALIAAIPGIISVAIKVAELLLPPGG